MNVYPRYFTLFFNLESNTVIRHGYPILRKGYSKVRLRQSTLFTQVHSHLPKPKVHSYLILNIRKQPRRQTKNSHHYCAVRYIFYFLLLLVIKKSLCFIFEVSRVVREIVLLWEEEKEGWGGVGVKGEQTVVSKENKRVNPYLLDKEQDDFMTSNCGCCFSLASNWKAGKQPGKLVCSSPTSHVPESTTLY